MSCNECPNSGLVERVGQIERETARFAAALEGIRANTDELVNFASQQVRLEERQISQGQAIDRAFRAIEDMTAKIDVRLRTIEAAMPTNSMAAKWVFAWVLGLSTIVGAALIRVIIK